MNAERLAEIRERDRDDDLARYYWSDTRDLLAEIELLQRGARTLGEIVDRQAVDICRIANVPMPDDGDADYALAWDRVAEMAAEVDRLTRELAEAQEMRAKVASFIAARAGYLQALRSSPSDDTDYYRWTGGAEARRQLATALGMEYPQ